MCDRFPRKFDVQTSYKPLNYVLGLVFVVNIKFLRATYHTIVPSTEEEELYCLNREANTGRGGGIGKDYEGLLSPVLKGAEKEGNKESQG